MSSPSPRRLLHFVTRRLRLRKYLQDPRDGRRQPQIPARLLLWALLVGQVLRQNSFHAVEALVRSPARRNLPISASFSDDEGGKAFEAYLNKKYPQQNKNIKIHVMFFVTPREKVIQNLNEGTVDMVIGGLTITPERQKLVDFSEPTVRG